MTVEELRPGDLVSNSGHTALFIAYTGHPLYPGMALVIWRLIGSRPQGDKWSHDALHLHQDVGDVKECTQEERTRRLREALLHRSQW